MEEENGCWNCLHEWLGETEHPCNLCNKNIPKDMWKPKESGRCPTCNQIIKEE